MADWDRCVMDLSSADGQVRVTATRRLFADPEAAVAALHRRGEKRGADGSIGEGYGAARERMILTLLEGLPPPESASYASTSFGLSPDHATTRDQIDAMGREHGFMLDAGEPFSIDTAPSCYVRLAPGSQLSEVLRNVLCREPHVLSVNLNWVER
jgi:hypothetical protein